MHERTTRAMARWLFVACCAVPTCLTFLVILVTWTPWYHNRCLRELEHELELRTGLDVHVGGFDRLDPASWRLSDVELRDSETQRTVASAPFVWWVANADSTAIRLSNPEVHAHSLDQVAKLVHDRFLCQPDQTQRPVRFAAEDLTIQGRASALTLRDVDAWLEPTPDGVNATVVCVPEGERPNCDGVQIQIRRDRVDGPPATTWSLQTGDLSVPVSMLADYFPSLERLGSAATFHGSLTVTEVPSKVRSRWSLDLGGGQFHQIDLANLTRDLPHRVTGQGKLSLVRCQLDGEGENNVYGSLEVHDGLMSASLLPRLAEDLGCQLLAPVEHDFGFDLLSFRFELYASQMRVEGTCRYHRGFEPLPAGVVLCVGGRPLVVSQDAWLPSAQLARTFAPPHSVSIPLSGQTMGLLSILQPPRSPMPLQGVASRPIGLPNHPIINPSQPAGSEAEPHRLATQSLGIPSPQGDAVPSQQETGIDEGLFLPNQPAARIGGLAPWGQNGDAIGQPR